MRHTHNFFSCQLVKNDVYGQAVITTEVSKDYRPEDFDMHLAFELLSMFQLVSYEAHSEYTTLRENYFFENVEMLPPTTYTGKWAVPFIKAEDASHQLSVNPAHTVDVLALCESEDGEILDFPFEEDLSLTLMKLKYEAIFAKIQAELKVDTLLRVECPQNDDGTIRLDAASLTIYPANYLPEEKQALDNYVQGIVKDFAFEQQPQNGNIPAHWQLTVTFDPK